MKYRVKAVAPDRYIVQEKWWLFWRCALWHEEHEDFDIPMFFYSPQAAQNMMHMKIAEKTEIEKHCAQQPWYFDA